MKSKRFLGLMAALLLAVIISFAAFAPAFAANPESAGPSSCSGTLVGTAYYDVITGDSKVGGGNWATDNLHRTVAYYDVGEGKYCVEVSDVGTYTTFAGNSPNGTGTVAAGITGQVNGGFIVIISATNTNLGNLGAYNFQCDQDGNCVAYVNWRDILFGIDGWSGNTSWLDWGWYYEGCAANGSWLNAASGNVGDITGEAVYCGPPLAAVGPIIQYNLAKLTDIPADLYLGVDNAFTIEYLSGRGQSCDLRLSGGDLNAPVYLSMQEGSLGYADGKVTATFALSDFATGATLVDFNGAESLRALAYCHGSSGGTANGGIWVTLYP